MKFYINVFVLLTLTDQAFCGPGGRSEKSSYKACRTVKLINSTQPNKNVLRSVTCNGQKYIQVPAELVGDKLQRYFTRTSTAAVAMSCCRAQVHRKCLQATFHSDSNNKCLGCCKSINRHVFAESRKRYLDTCSRKKSCDFCHESLGQK